MVKLVMAAKALFSFAVSFVIDFISEIVVSAIVFPAEVIEKKFTRPMNTILKPL